MQRSPRPVIDRPMAEEFDSDFSTAVTGSLFFVPTADFLDDPPSLPGATDDGAGNGGAGSSEETDPVAPGDGSLGIGGLTGSST